MEQCGIVEWVDEPWPEHTQESLKELWNELKTTRRCEARANEVLHEAIQCNEIANTARVALLEEVNRTKRRAQSICLTYQKKAAIAIVEKYKLMYLIYCVLGLVAFMVVFLFSKIK